MAKPNVVFVGNEKGGCGKTTTAYTLSCDLIIRGFSTVLIDNDPQKGANRWRRCAGDYIHPPIATLENPLEEIDLEPFQAVDFIVIDGSPGFGDDPRLREAHELLHQLIYSEGLNDKMRQAVLKKVRKIFGFDGTVTAKMSAAIKLSNLVIVPTIPSSQDLEPSIALVNKLIVPAMRMNPYLDYRILINDGNERTILQRDAINVFQSHGLKYFNTTIEHREIYRQSAANGFTVAEVQTDKKATAQSRSLTDEVLKIFNMAGCIKDIKTGEML